MLAPLRSAIDRALPTDRTARALRCSAEPPLDDDGFARTDRLGSYDWLPIGFTSRTLAPHERRYGARQGEFLGILHALRRNKSLLRSKQCPVLTDHMTLQQMINSPDVTKTAGARLERWLWEIAEFPVRIRYHPGRLNLADPPSRQPSTTLPPDDSGGYDAYDLAHVVEGDVLQAGAALERAKIDADFQDKTQAINDGMNWLNSLRSFTATMAATRAQKQVAMANIQLGYQQLQHQRHQHQ